MPTPLYVLYHREWDLTPGQISIVFAIYAASLIPSLLFLGGISDGIGRRKTLLIAIAIAALGALVFAFASGLWWLVAARALQGVSLAIGLPTAVAAVREWMVEATRPLAGTLAIVGTSVGSAFGALLAGVLAEYAPLPNALTFLVYIVLLGCLPLRWRACPRARTWGRPRTRIFRPFRARSGGRFSSLPANRSSVGLRLQSSFRCCPRFWRRG